MTYVEHDRTAGVHRWRCDGPRKLKPGEYAPPGSARCGQYLSVPCTVFSEPVVGEVPADTLARTAAASLATREEPWLNRWQFVRVVIDDMPFGADLAGEITWDRVMCPDHRMPFLNDDEHAGDPIVAFGGSEKGADIAGAVTRAHHEDGIERAFERALVAGPPPLPIEKRFEAPVSVAGTISRRWREDRPGVRGPEPYKAEVEVWAGEYDGGSQYLTPAEARQAAAALIAAADWAEAQL